MLNQVMLAGRLTHDPEYKETSKGAYCLLKLAVQRPFKNKDGQYDVDFFDMKTWQGNAMNVYKSCKKGSLIVALARLVPNNYVNKDNQKVYGIEIIADRVIFMGRSKDFKDLGEEVEAISKEDDE